MSGVRIRGEEVRRFILSNIESHGTGLSKLVAEHFHITRQAVNKHLHRLIARGVILQVGKTRSYKLAPLIVWENLYEISPGMAEDVIWRNEINPVLGKQPENVMEILNYGFTEMFNNVIDHSGGSEVFIHIERTALNTMISIMDNGIGIFKKIQNTLNLLDERHAILELSKGKLTTDPIRHTGEGIFFTSRMFDSFDILSGGIYFRHEFGHRKDWIPESSRYEQGTTVWMELNNHTARTTKKIFDSFMSKDDFGFTKTVVPVRLARYGDDKLISRSQAKRLLARVELFKIVILDFSDVPTIGQAFADEIFRVFPQQHPETAILFHKANSEVKRMIDYAKLGEMKNAGIETTQEVGLS